MDSNLIEKTGYEKKLNKKQKQNHHPCLLFASSEQWWWVIAPFLDCKREGGTVDG